MDSKNLNAQNYSIDYGDEVFFADSFVIMHGRGKFILDLKKATPRLDHIENEKQNTVVIRHNPIVLDPENAKALLKVLKRNVEIYEQEFGEIELEEREQQEVPEEEYEYIG